MYFNFVQMYLNSSRRWHRWIDRQTKDDGESQAKIEQKSNSKYPTAKGVSSRVWKSIWKRTISHFRINVDRYGFFEPTTNGICC